MKIQESGEMYLETVLVLKKRLGNVRSIDVANEMNFSKPSVSIAMRRLRENGFVEFDSSGFISLTEKGNEIAENLYQKHLTVTNLLQHIGVDPIVAEKDACRIEHIISEETFEKIHELYKTLVEPEEK